MSEIYVYSAQCDDFTNFGLVGALTPASCVFEEVANGMSEITLEHPIDALGRYNQLVTNNLIMVEVPVRTTPEIDGTTIVTSVEKWTASKYASRANRTIYKKRSVSDEKKDVKIKVIPGGTKVTMVKNYASGRCKIKCRYGTGWIERDGLEYTENITIADNSQSIESVEPAWTVKPQLFRIYSVEKSIMGVTVMARHISYDLLYNLTTFKTAGSVTCADALAGIMSECVSDHDFDAYTNLVTARTGVNWTRTNPIDAILNPDNGLTTRYGASLVRDNWELYILHDPGLNRGVTIEYGKNLTGITYTESFDSTATRIVPVGETSAGKPLMLAGETPWVDSVRINDYPIIYTQELICEDCKSGNGVSAETVRKKMKEQAQAVFDAGGDLPSVEMSVEFINLGDTAEYAQYKDLERLFLWDYVTVRHKLHGIDVISRIVSIRWNCLLDRMEGMDIGSVGKTLANSGITSWQIPTGISGSKIASGTVGAGALGDGAVSSDHLQAESVNAEKIAAESITANEIAAGAITTDKLSTGSVTADKIAAGAIDADAIEAVTAEIQKIVAGSISANEITTAIMDAMAIYGKTGVFDFGKIKDLVAGAMIVEKARANLMSITNLYVTSANLLNAVIGKLVLQDAEGNYYEIGIGADGSITTKPVELTDDEIANGETGDGRVISGTAINAEIINGKDVFASFAEINTIVSEALKTGSLTATDAFIASATVPTLYTTAIQAIGDTLDLSANKSITLMVGKKSNVFRQDDLPTEANVGDLCIQPTGGKTYQCSAAAAGDVSPPTFSMDGGNLVYTPSADSPELTMYIDDNGELIYDNVTYGLSIDADGNIGIVSELTWDEVADEALVGTVHGLTKKSLTREELNDYYMRIDADNGVDIGRSDSNSRLVLTNEGVGVKIGGQTFSRFTSNYVQFGDYQIRRSAKGALVIKKAREVGEVVSALLQR